MATSVIDHLRRAVLLRDGAGLGDGELLGCFIERHDEAALAALVRRHGPMVWGVCRRLLSHHDAEDAFQATFIVLVRKAASIVPRVMVGNWLYGVAHQTALQSRRTATRRRAREVQVTEMPDTAIVQPDQWPDVRPLLDQELSRLSDNYRAVIVLCDLEGRTRKEVARQLGVPEGTVAGRLPRARAMLAKRLARRGVALSGGALTAVLAQNAASASVSISLMSTTIQAAILVAVGQTAATGAISVNVAALTEGVLRAMLMCKLKAVIAVMLVLGFITTGATVLTLGTAAAQSDPSAVAEERVKSPSKPEQEKAAFTAWGKEVGGLQAGLGFHPGQKRAYSHGEIVKVVARIRNVGKQVVEFKHIWAFFVENPPKISDADGRLVQLPRYAAEGLQMPRSPSVPPGKDIELYEWEFDLRPQGESGTKLFTIHGTGTFSLQCERIVGPTSANPNHPNPTLSKLATGKLELAVKAQERRKKPPVDLGKIQPPGGVPLALVKPGTNAIGVDELNKVRERLEAVPEKDLEKWVVELERIMDKKLQDGLPSARQVCRTDFAIHLSVAFDDLKWNPKTADNLFKRAQAMPATEAKVWKEAFETLLKKEIGQTDTALFAGGPEWAVPLVLIPVDALHEGQKYSAQRGKKYLARLKQLTVDDIFLWKDQVDEYGGTKLDAAVNIILLDDFFDNETFQRDKFKAAIGARKK